MEFVTLDVKEFEEFSINHPLKTFFQTPEIGQLRKMSNWDVNYVGVKKDNKLIGATMIVSALRHFGQREFYAPRGFLIDYNDKELLTFFTKEIKKYVKDRKGYVLRVDPYFLYKEKDINGNLVENGIDNSYIVDEMKKLGYISKNSQEQVKLVFVLDIKGKDEDEILKEMSSNTRNLIKKASKHGIVVRELSYDELPIFQDIMNQTGERRNFSVRNLDYFQKMYKLFHDKNEVKYLITELDLNGYIDRLNNEIKEQQEKMSKLSDNKANDKKRENYLINCQNLSKYIKQAEDIKKKTGKEKIVLSGSMFMLTKPEVVYLSSGNYEEYMSFNSQYLIQWEMIKYAIANGYNRYNFYGIMSNFDKSDPNYGLYLFKKGFGGHVEELVGEFDLPINNFYKIFRLLKKV